jgi:NAD(P)H-binding
VRYTQPDEIVRLESWGWCVRVLAIGATGQFAGLVVPALVSRGVQVRALVHDPVKQDRVQDAGADQAVVGDLRDPAGMRSASMRPVEESVYRSNPSIALQGLPDASLRDGLLAMFADYSAHGFHGGNSLALRTILGRTPRSPNDFFAELAR